MRRKMDIRMLLLYFVLGGAIISAVTYFGSQSRGMLAAFITFLPTVSVISLCTIYLASGTQSAISYAKSMLVLLPPWFIYVIGVIFLLPRIGLVYSLIVSISVYLAIALLIVRFI
jgi:uncharacterized membrane protein (GlpM family)